MPRRNPFTILSTLLLLLLSKTLAKEITNHPGIIHLTDSTFEHETQASTGMTTGSWLLFFYSRECPHSLKLLPSFELLANVISPVDIDENEGEDTQDEGIANDVKGVVLGMINVQQNKITTTRFNLQNSNTPTLLYLHRGRMYKYPMPKYIPHKAHDEQLGKIKLFLKSVHRGVQGSGFIIPKPLSSWDTLKQSIEKMLRDLIGVKGGAGLWEGKAGYVMVVVLSVGLVITTGILIALLLRGSDGSMDGKKRN